MQKSLQSKLFMLYAKRDNLVAQVEECNSSGVFVGSSTQQVLDFKERQLSQTEHALKELNLRHEKESRIKLELSSMIAMFCM